MSLLLSLDFSLGLPSTPHFIHRHYTASRIYLENIGDILCMMVFLFRKGSVRVTFGNKSDGCTHGWDGRCVPWRVEEFTEANCLVGLLTDRQQQL